jgi:hypothetical protein
VRADARLEARAPRPGGPPSSNVKRRMRGFVDRQQPLLRMVAVARLVLGSVYRVWRYALPSARATDGSGPIRRGRATWAVSSVCQRRTQRRREESSAT